MPVLLHSAAAVLVVVLVLIVVLLVLVVLILVVVLVVHNGRPFLSGALLLYNCNPKITITV